MKMNETMFCVQDQGFQWKQSAEKMLTVHHNMLVFRLPARTHVQNAFVHQTKSAVCLTPYHLELSCASVHQTPLRIIMDTAGQSVSKCVIILIKT